MLLLLAHDKWSVTVWCVGVRCSGSRRRRHRLDVTGDKTRRDVIVYVIVEHVVGTISARDQQQQAGHRQHVTAAASWSPSARDSCRWLRHPISLFGPMIHYRPLCLRNPLKCSWNYNYRSSVNSDNLSSAFHQPIIPYVTDAWFPVRHSNITSLIKIRDRSGKCRGQRNVTCARLQCHTADISVTLTVNCTWCISWQITVEHLIR